MIPSGASYDRICINVVEIGRLKERVIEMLPRSARNCVP